MSLGIAFKGPEGIVLAADSRVTLQYQERQGDIVHQLPATFDNATKLLRVAGQDFVGAVTYGVGAIGVQQPRTAHSFLPEFEDDLADQGITDRLTVEDFAAAFSEFFMKQWHDRMPDDYTGQPLMFLIGGYNEGDAYGKVYRIGIPSQPEPEEQNSGAGVFGITWGGQLKYTTRLISGFDPQLLPLLQQQFGLTDDEVGELSGQLRQNLGLRIPYQFLPLQDCVDLSILLIRTTIQIQTFIVGVRGVGGAIDVATITRTKGFEAIQQKEIAGEAPITEI